MEQKKLIIFMPVIQIGGIEKNLFIISNYLANKFKNVSLISTSKEYKNKFNSKIQFIQPENNWNKVTNRIKFLICLYLLAIEIIKNKNSSVFCFQADIYCILLCKLLKTKIIVRLGSSPASWSKKFLKKILYINILSMADIIIVNSLEFRKQLKERFNLNSVCIYNPLNINEILRLSKIKVKNNFFKKKFINIINVARFEEEKDHLTLLKSINLLKDNKKIRLLLIGGGNTRKKILEYIKLNKLTKIVKIINYRQNPYPFIKKSSLFILSSRFEGLPNVLLEAIALNKFIISSDCSTGPREILFKNKGGLLFKVSDYIGLSKQILFFISNRKICNKKLLFAKSKLYRFDEKNNLNKYLKLVKRTLTI
jgi:glycosyltransferase involved in cell wall biosynthesis